MNLLKCGWIVALTLVPAASLAGPREDIVDGMAKCAAIADNSARLACFDALVPQVKAAQAAPPETAPPADTRAWYDPSRIFGISPSQQTTPEQFGSENLTAPTPPPPKPGEPAPPAPPQALDSITAKVTDYALNPFGRITVFLDNGQIWRQLDGDTDHAHMHGGGGNTVEISRGMLGSYDMVINGVGVALKVQRIK